MKNIVLVVAILALAVIAVSVLAPGNPLSRLFLSKEVVVVTPNNDDSSLSAGGLASPTESVRTFEIITVLPQDAIRAILSPTFLSGDEADAQMSDDEPVIGVSINGDHRAYSVPFLSSREIVNDVVGGKPIAVTW